MTISCKWLERFPPAAIPVIPPADTLAASPVIPPVVTLTTSPVTPPVVTLAASPVIPPVVTLAASPVVPVSQAASPAISPVVFPAASASTQSAVSVVESHVPFNNFSMAANVLSSGSSPSTAVQPSASSFDCSLCSKKFSLHFNLWQHIDAVHIAKCLFPCVTSFEAGNRLACSKPSC